MRNLSEWLIFPFFMISSVLGTYLLAFEAQWPIFISVFATLIPTALIIWSMEYIIPYRKKWNQNDNDVLTDSLHLVVEQILIPRLAKLIFSIALIPITVYLASKLSVDLWPHDWPLIAQLFLMLLIAEFGRYWIHRWAHKNMTLWKFHSIHHSPNRLYWLNAGRFHPIEKIYLLIPEVVPFIILGTNKETITLYFVFNAVHGLFQHSNISLKLGWFNYVFSTADLHRWHHSKIIKESDNNFGNNLIIWDIIFGTYFNPEKRNVGVIGLYNQDFPKIFWGHIKAPFSKIRLDKPLDYSKNRKYYDEKVISEAQYNESLYNAK